MIEKLRKQLASLREKANGIIAAAEKEDRGLTPEETATLADLTQQGRATEESIKALNNYQALEQSVDAQQPLRTQRPTPTAGYSQIEVGENRERLDPMRGFSHAVEFARAVKHASRPTGPIDQRLLNIQATPTNFHQEGGAAEGWEVPPAIRDEIWSVAFAEDSMLSRFTAEPISSNHVTLGADESTPWSTSGVYARMRDEGDQMTPQKQTLKPRIVSLHEMYVFVSATDEILSDAPRLQNRLTVVAGRAINWKATALIFEGNGVGQPLGFTKAACVVEQAKVTGQTADTINATNAVQMKSRLIRLGGARPFWALNPDAETQLPLMTIGQVPVWTPMSAGMSAEQDGALLGYDVLPSELCETLGDAGDIWLVNPAGYYLINHTDGVRFDSSIHLWFDYGLTAFRWTYRIGGEPLLSAAVSPYKGSSTRSYFVKLAVRS